MSYVSKKYTNGIAIESIFSEDYTESLIQTLNLEHIALWLAYKLRYYYSDKIIISTSKIDIHIYGVISYEIKITTSIKLIDADTTRVITFSYADGVFNVYSDRYYIDKFVANTLEPAYVGTIRYNEFNPANVWFNLIAIQQ